MAKTGSKDPATNLAPLLDVIRGGRHLRLIARPGAVTVDGSSGSSAVDVSWTEAQHKTVIGAAIDDAPLSFDDGCTATVIGGALVLRRPPDPSRRIDDLVQDGRVSALAGRTLSAALDAGRNILLTGPWCAALELIGALLAEGHRPLVVGAVGDAVAPAWPLVSDADDVATVGADRIAAWSVRGDALIGLMSQASGVVAWMDAGRLDRLLMRFEAEAERVRVSSPLQVMAAVDLVVVMTAGRGARVHQVAEIDMVEDGYRPRLLFSTGVPPVPSALVPVSLPSFVDDLDRAGHTVLADELRHAAAPVEPAPMAAPAAAQPPAAPEPCLAPTPVVEVGAAPRAPRIDPSLQGAPPPGWELDQISVKETDGETHGEDSSTASPEDASLAATFGLGPPPPPPGVSPMVAEAMRSEPTFEDALRRARERDDELREQEESDDV
ncbi:MAG: hypothetical protein V3T05_10295 [Myxococcota bacterium]